MKIGFVREAYAVINHSQSPALWELFWHNFQSDKCAAESSTTCPMVFKSAISKSPPPVKFVCVWGVCEIASNVITEIFRSLPLSQCALYKEREREGNADTFVIEMHKQWSCTGVVIQICQNEGLWGDNEPFVSTLHCAKWPKWWWFCAIAFYDSILHTTMYVLLVAHYI